MLWVAVEKQRVGWGSQLSLCTLPAGSDTEVPNTFQCLLCTI